MTEKTASRRSFLDLLLGLAGAVFLGGVAYPTGKFLWPPKSSGARKGSEPIRIGLEDLPVNTGKIVRYRGEPTIVVRREAGVFALSAVCPHLGCLVKWDEAKEELLCPCHAATFDLNGNITGGPSPEPLASVPVKRIDDAIVIGG